MNKRLVALAFTLASTLVFTACGNSKSSSSSTSSSSGTTTQSQASGAPIKLMTIGPVDAPGFSLPSIPVGAEVAIQEINDAGGINGHQLELITCNDKNDPNTATQCARQALKEKVTALVGGLSIFDLKAIPPLERAGIPWIGLSTPDAYSQSNMFLMGGEGAPSFTGIGLALAQAGCKSIAIVQGAQGVDANTQQIEAGVVAGGAKVAKKLKAPANSADWAPTVAAARSAGADCIGAGTGPAESGALIAAANAGSKLKLAFASGGLPDVVVKQIGKAADGVLVTSGYFPFTSNQGVVEALKQKIQAKAPKSPLDQFAQTGYAAVKVLQEAAKGLSDVTPASLTKALSGVTGFDTGLGPVVDFSTPGSVPGFERLFNPKVFVLVAKNGDYALAKPEPIDTTPALKVLTGQ